MVDSLLADSILSGTSEIEGALAIVVLAMAGGLLLGYLLGGLIARIRDPQDPVHEATGEPLYAVVLHNDDFNTFGFVIGVLGKVFAYGGPRGFWLALKVHCSGRGVVWTGTLEAAELRAAQIRSYGPDPQGKRGVQALKVSVEPHLV